MTPCRRCRDRQWSSVEQLSREPVAVERRRIDVAVRDGKVAAWVKRVYLPDADTLVDAVQVR
jgi:hypothetical protein